MDAKMTKTEVLARVHANLLPRTYLEIGVNRGRSLELSLSRTLSIGVDPSPKVDRPLPRRSHIVESTSDEFFASGEGPSVFDLVFIDGLHLAEYALRDLRHAEARLAPYGTVVIDDVLPRDAIQAQRERSSRLWAGDVWKVAVCARKSLRHVSVSILDTAPCGLMVLKYGPRPRPRSDWYGDVSKRLGELTYEKDFTPREWDVLPPSGATVDLIASPLSHAQRSLAGLVHGARAMGSDRVLPYAREMISRATARTPV